MTSGNRFNKALLAFLFIRNATNSLVHKNRIQLDGLVEDQLFTIVFVLIYELGEPRAAKDRRVSSMVRSLTAACSGTRYITKFSVNFIIILLL